MFIVLIDLVSNAAGDVHTAFFEFIVKPLVDLIGQSRFIEQAFDGSSLLLLGLLQMLLIALVFLPLQRLYPVESVVDHKTIALDILYTAIDRLGLMKLVFFFTLDVWLDSGFSVLRGMGIPTWHLDSVWLGVTDVPWVSWVLYLVFFDFLGYWLHRAQHQLPMWWRLHALHHAQKQMTAWSDNRNHVLDMLLIDASMACVAQLVGAAPSQFVGWVVVMQLSQSLQHANIRLWFGSIGERLWVSPRFHRLHHSIHTDVVNRNFGVLLPWWDIIFGTANFDLRFDATGVDDGVDYGDTWFKQQWLGFKRLFVHPNEK